MPTIVKDSRAAFRRMFLATDQKVLAGLDTFADEIGQDFFSQIMQRQPRWTGDDPLRDERPSERQGLVPIHKGWLGGPQKEHVAPNSVDIVLRSESQHVQYFTSMMGRRQYLGTRNTHGIDAKPGGYLRFWLNGREYRTTHVDHRGFRVEEDFVKLAWEAILPKAKKLLGDLAKISLITAADEVP